MNLYIGYISSFTLNVSVCLQTLIDIEIFYRPIPNIINIIVLLLVLRIYLYSILDSICIFQYDCCCSGDGDDIVVGDPNGGDDDGVVVDIAIEIRVRSQRDLKTIKPHNGVRLRWT